MERAAELQGVFPPLTRPSFAATGRRARRCGPRHARAGPDADSHSGRAGKCILPCLLPSLCTQGPAPDSKPHPPDPTPLRKSGLCQVTISLQADPSLHSPTCRLQTTDLYPWFGSVDKNLITAEYPVIPQPSSSYRLTCRKTSPTALTFPPDLTGPAVAPPQC